MDSGMFIALTVMVVCLGLAVWLFSYQSKLNNEYVSKLKAMSEYQLKQEYRSEKRQAGSGAFGKIHADNMRKIVQVANSRQQGLVQKWNDEEAAEERRRIERMATDPAYRAAQLAHQAELANAKAYNSQGTKRIDNKEASVVGRAVAGGIIAGQAGAVVGALSAVDKNNRNAASNSETHSLYSDNNSGSSKDASVIGRAVAGGIIAGQAGAVVGALSAVDKNNKNRSEK